MDDFFRTCGRNQIHRQCSKYEKDLQLRYFAQTHKVKRQRKLTVVYFIGLGRDKSHGKDSHEVRKGTVQDDDKEDEQPLVVPDELYLEACQIYLCPSFPAAKATRYKKMIRNAGGIHVTEFDPQEVTHVLVPSDTLEPR